MNIKNIISWFPGIIFPLSLLVTIYKIYVDNSTKAINPFTYLVFFIAGCFGFLFSNNILKLNNIFGFLVPTFLNVIILYLYFLQNDVKYLYYVLSLCLFSYLFMFYVYNYKFKLLKKYSKILGIIVNLLLPFATFLQLYKIYINKSSKGVSLITWALQIFGNLGLYFLQGQYNDPITLVGSFGTSIICAFIIYFAHLYKH